MRARRSSGRQPLETLVHSRFRLCGLGVVVTAGLALAVAACAEEAPPPEATASATLETRAAVFAWQIVVNNGAQVPGDGRPFNSYNQPSVNVGKLVVFRARSRGGSGGEPAHGVFVRDMTQGTPLTTSFARTTFVPQPNNLETQFVEPPSFPRIDMWSSTIASRGNHPPVFEYLLGDGTETRGGTTGIYTNPYGDLIAGANNLGAVPGFELFGVPATAPALKFDVFPGAPAVTDGATIVFKGNHTTSSGGKTGVYYRDLTNAPLPAPGGGMLAPAGGTAPVIVLADTDTVIPGALATFGSTAPPSAVGRRAVFAGFDDEDAPTLGGLYLVPLTGPRPPLTALVKIGAKVPGEAKAVFNKLGEGVSFDGRFVAFWGAWGSATRTLNLQCPTDGNADVVAFCNQQHPGGFTTTVPLHQGIFVHDTHTGQTRVVAKAPGDFDDFVYWNFSGLVPGTGESDEEGEPARWRAASFVAVSGLVDGNLGNATFHTAFKARTGAIVNGSYLAPIDGIYLREGPGLPAFDIVAQTGMAGTAFDPAAVVVDETTGVPVVLPVTQVGLERDGFRGSALAINVSMGTEEAGWAGIYLTTVPDDDAAGEGD